MSNIFFDIETIPAQSPQVLNDIANDLKAKMIEDKANVTAPGNYKKPESIAEYVEAERARLDAAFDGDLKAAIERTSLDGAYGQVFCICWAIDGGRVKWLDVGGDLSLNAEASLIRQWFDALKEDFSGSHGTRPCLTGHNSNEFDIPFLWKRAMIHGVRPPLWFPRDPKPWGDSTADTMTMWAGTKNRISMDRLCKILGLPGKDGMSGKDVWPAVQRGEFSKVVTYCVDDVERTRAMYRRMTFLDMAPQALPELF